MVDMAMEDEDDVEDDPEPGGEAGVLLEEAADSEDKEQGEVGEAHGGERPAAAGEENKLKIKQNLIRNNLKQVLLKSNNKSYKGQQLGNYK